MGGGEEEDEEEEEVEQFYKQLGNGMKEIAFRNMITRFLLTKFKFAFFCGRVVVWSVYLAKIT